MNTNNPCREFRSLLEDELLRPGMNAELTTLSWHEHLLSCGECRELLASEEALEELLSSLPQPRLPQHLVKRVLRRLRRARTGSDLDRLLEADAQLDAPSGLSDRLLSSLAGSRRAHGDALDQLLDVYEVRADEGLSDRILGRLQAERAIPILPFYARPTAKVLLAMAALFLIYLATVQFASNEPKTLTSTTEVAFADPDLLEEYYLLDNWHLLMPESDIELLIATAISPAEDVALGLEQAK